MDVVQRMLHVESEKDHAKPYLLCLGHGCQWVAVAALAGRLKHNGPVVWGVAVCVRVGMCFCKVPVNGRKVSDHDKVVQIAESR